MNISSVLISFDGVSNDNGKELRKRACRNNKRHGTRSLDDR